MNTKDTANLIINYMRAQPYPVRISLKKLYEDCKILPPQALAALKLLKEEKKIELLFKGVRGVNSAAEEVSPHTDPDQMIDIGYAKLLGANQH